VNDDPPKVSLFRSKGLATSWLGVREDEEVENVSSDAELDPGTTLPIQLVVGPLTVLQLDVPACPPHV
jgi:hypothetical protein